VALLVGLVCSPPSSKRPPRHQPAGDVNAPAQEAIVKDSKITWTNHTFNIVWGCEKVSEGCKFCYAESLANRWRGKGALPLWGPGSVRRPMSDAYWAEPAKWNKAAMAAGKPALVFCSSMADVFEDHPELVAPRVRLFRLIEATPWLRWLLLTKRPQNMVRLARDAGWSGAWPETVWAGCTVESQARANERIPHLLTVPARVRFLSCEPLLERVQLHCIPANLQPLDFARDPYGSDYLCTLTGREYEPQRGEYGQARYPRIHWVIVGGESGHGARPFDLAWARSLRDQCGAADVPFFCKQLGARPVGLDWTGGALRLQDKAGADIEEFPEDLRVQRWPSRKIAS
jgi:protein gp37